MNEIGLDPGIDHVYAVKTIDEVHAQGGKVFSTLFPSLKTLNIGSRSRNSIPIAAAFLPLNRPIILLDTNSPGRHAGCYSLCSMPPHGFRTARSAVSRGKS
jgi:hypothetical protein